MHSIVDSVIRLLFLSSVDVNILKTTFGFFSFTQIVAAIFFSFTVEEAASEELVVNNGSLSLGVSSTC